MSTGSSPEPPGPPTRHSPRGPLLIAAVLVLVVAGLLGTAAYLGYGYLTSQTDRQGSGPALPDDRRLAHDDPTEQPPPGDDAGPGLVRFQVVLEERPGAGEDCPSGGGWTSFDGECLRLGAGMFAEVRAKVAEQEGRPVVDLRVEPPADRTLKTFSRRHQGKRIALVAQDEVLTAPQITAPIPDGRIWLAGAFGRPEAEQMAARINGSS